MTTESLWCATARFSQRFRRCALRLAAALALILLAGIVLTVTTQAPVAAHTGLNSSQPANGDYLSEPVSEISMTFNRPVEPVGDGFTVFDARGLQRRPASLSSADGQSWRMHFAVSLGDGSYRVLWRVTAEDGHIVQGTFAFTVVVSPAGHSSTPSLDSTATSVTESGEPADQALAHVADEDAAGRTSATITDETESQAITDALNLDGEVPAVISSTPSATMTSDVEVSPESGIASASEPLRRWTGAVGAQRVAEGATILSLLATLGLVGGLAFSSFIVRDTPSDRNRAHRLVSISGLALAASTVVIAPMRAVDVSGDWSALWSIDAIADVLAAPFGIAAGLRVLGGLAVLVAPHPDAPGSSRSRFGIVSLIGAALVIVSYSFDGHTVTEGPRWLHAAASATHVYAAGVWAGGTVLLADLLRRRGNDTRVIRPLMRFSQMAAMSLGLAGVAGTAMAVLVMDRFADLWSTAWGRLLLGKVALVALAVYLGARNRWVHMPNAMHLSDQHAQSLAGRRLHRSVVVEAAVLGCVGVITAFLVGASTL